MSTDNRRRDLMTQINRLELECKQDLEKWRNRPTFDTGAGSRMLGQKFIELGELESKLSIMIYEEGTYNESRNH